MQVVSQPQRRYTTAQVSKQLGIAPETLRKYNSLFYGHGIQIPKIKGKLMYSKEDVDLFRKLQQLHSVSRKPLSDCISEVLGVANVTNVVAEDSNVIQLVSEVPMVDPQLPQLDAKLIKQRLEHLEQEQERLKKENETLRSSIDKKVLERDTALLEVIRSVQEMKKEIATIKKKKWWQFWR